MGNSSVIPPEHQGHGPTDSSDQDHAGPRNRIQNECADRWHLEPQPDQKLREGHHTLIVTATENGNTNESEFSFTVDLTRPKTSFAENYPALPTYPPSATFAFSSNEESTFVCSLDKADFSPCTSPFTVERLSDGAHSFRVRARDRAGNDELEPAIYEWTRELAVIEGSGCSAPGGTLSGALAGVLLSLLAAHHRRASKARISREN